MTWFKELTVVELVFAGIFLLLYLLYILRIKRLAKFFNRGGNLVWVKFFVRAGIFFFLIVALLGPSFGDTEKEIKSVGRDVYFAIDVSASMNAQDLQPSRLQRVILEISNVIRSLNSDRIGLIIFSDEAYIQCPLTFDHKAVLLFLQSINTNLVPGGSTDIGAALELGAKKLNSAQGKPAGELAKALVVVTDGEDFGDGATRLARQLARKNINLFFVGVGTEKGGKIPTGHGFKRYEDGSVVITRLNQEKLRDLVRQSAGGYFELSENRNETNRLLKSLNYLKGNVRATKTLQVADNKYIYPLVGALFLIAIDILLTLTVIKV